MISPNTVDKVFDLEIDAVISKYITLKPSGSSLKAKSPFVDEKSASFMVSPSKGIFKCFSSGKGGNSGVSFVMQFMNLEYPDAVKEVAGQFGILIEYDDGDNAKENIKKRAIQHDLYEVNQVALEYFHSQIENIDKKHLRNDKDQGDLFSVGYADNEPKSFLHYALEKGLSSRVLLEAGLISHKTSSFDFFRNRLIFPIYSHKKRIVGFGGRTLEAPDENGKYPGLPKYINTKQTPVFDKSRSLFGIQLAVDAIRKSKKANIVEGYTDVIAMHSEGLINTVAPCGTSFTKQQAEILFKYCDLIRLVFDGDKAGRKAIERSVPILIEIGFKVELCLLPEKDDPDSLSKRLKGKKDESFTGFIEDATEDAVMYLIKQFQDGSKDSAIKQSQAQTKTEKLLSLVPDNRLRNLYVKDVAKQFEISKTEIEKNIKMEVVARKPTNDDDGAPKVRLPEGAKQEDYENDGFVEIAKSGNKKTGYHFPKYRNNMVVFEQRSNFTIKPLFHIYSKTDNKRLVEITNHKATRLIDVPSRGFVGMTQFQEVVIDEGNFLFYGSKVEFQMVVKKIMEKFPTCIEIKTLGWQQEGFFAYADGIAETTFKKVDPNGIIAFGKEQYFLPAFSEVYKNIRIEDDQYENHRFFVYKKSPVTFAAWCEKFVTVHGDNGVIGVCFFIAAIFRDFIYNIHKVFPHLFLFGGVSTGKSYCARSINSLFHGGQPGFNLTSGTNVGFFRKLAMVRNAVSWFDEYENDIDQKRFQALKAAYDGLGHEKGVMSRDNRTETTKINSSSVISGQYLPTRDDNSLFTRSIVLSFTRKAEDLTNQEIKEGAELKKWELEGLSSLIVDVVKYRGEIEEKFEEVSFQIHEEFKKRLAEQQYSGRIMLNLVLAITPVKILGEKLGVTFSFDDLMNRCSQMILDQSDQVYDSDALRTFWKMIEFLFETYKIEAGKDFKIQTESSVNIKVNREERKVITFDQPKELLYLRLSKIHPLYMESHRKQHGENGINDTTLKTYMKSNKAFIGLCPATGFDNSKTSAYVFDYPMLNISLHGLAKETVPHPQEKDTRKDEDLPF